MQDGIVPVAQQGSRSGRREWDAQYLTGFTCPFAGQGGIDLGERRATQEIQLQR